MAARQHHDTPTGTGEQRECGRGAWCAASTRDADDVWHPALTHQPYCGPCSDQIVNCLTGLPELYALLKSGPAGIARRAGQKSRQPAGPRIHISVAADALARETSALLAGWGARVRAVPNLRLAPPEHPLGSPKRVREDCLDMARRPSALFALADGWTSRIYDLPETGSAHLLDRASGVCRKCGRTVSRSRVSGWWWSSDGKPTGFCDHDPGRITRPAPRQPVPEDLEGNIGDDEIVDIGGTWIKVLQLRSGLHAGAEILDLHWQARRLTGQAPAGPERLDGMPCRACEDMALVRADLPAGPEDPGCAPPFSHCQSCREEMTRAEYDDWAVKYAAWTKAALIVTCRRCDQGNCDRCSWKACTCRAGGHPRRRAA